MKKNSGGKEEAKGMEKKRIGRDREGRRGGTRKGEKYEVGVKGKLKWNGKRYRCKGCVGGGWWWWWWW